MRTLRKPAYDVGPQPRGCLQRHAAPQVSGQCKLGIRRREIGWGPPPDHAYLIVERLYLHVPSRLELVRSSVLLAPAKVKRAHTSIDGALDQLPMDEIIRGQSVRVRRCTRIVRK